MCDAFGFTIGVVLGQCIDNKQHVKTLKDAQLNYTTTEKEFLAIVFALKNLFIPTWNKNHNIH